MKRDSTYIDLEEKRWEGKEGPSWRRKGLGEAWREKRACVEI